MFKEQSWRQKRKMDTVLVSAKTAINTQRKCACSSDCFYCQPPSRAGRCPVPVGARGC